jgi:hypothetical protein
MKGKFTYNGTGSADGNVALTLDYTAAPNVESTDLNVSSSFVCGYALGLENRTGQLNVYVSSVGAIYLQVRDMDDSSTNNQVFYLNESIITPA